MSAAVAEVLARCRAAGLSLLVEGDTLHVDYESEPPPDLIERLRQHKAEVIATLTAPAAVIAPARWAAAAVGERPEPSFDMPCPERRGLVERRGGAFLHFCRECGRWGAYGYGCSSNSPGRWYCREHRPNE
jgi:hypothetical protein